MDANDILARFSGAVQEADGYVVRCPAHPDGHPSLKIWFDTDKCRLTCRAGCKTADVLRAAGLKWADLFDVTGERKTVSVQRADLVSGAPVALLRQFIEETSGAYLESPADDYAARRFGVTGELAAELKLGYNGAVWSGSSFPYAQGRFRQYPRLTVPLRDFRGIAKGLQGRDISGKCPGRWLSLTNPDGLRWLPYGVFRPAAETVIITEGPGDGLSAVAANEHFGAVVIRGASLASNAELTAELATHLRGRFVIIAGDNDPAGRKFTRTVNAALREHAVVPCGLEIPARNGDITAWRERLDTSFPGAFTTAVMRAHPIPAKPNKAADKRMRGFGGSLRGEI